MIDAELSQRLIQLGEELTELFVAWKVTSTHHVRMVQFLYRHESATLTEIADFLDISPTAVGAARWQLVDRGLLEADRLGRGLDMRKVLVRLTPDCRAKLDKLFGVEPVAES